MQIYIEDVLISNTIINFVQLYQIKKILKIKRSNLSLVISSILGAVITLVYPLLKLNGIYLTIFKLLVMVFVVKTAFFNQSSKKLLIINIIFLVLSFIFSGMVTFFRNENINSIFLVIPFCIISYIIEKIKDFLEKKLKKSTFLYKTDFKMNGKTIQAYSFLDSGNSIKYKGKNLMIISVNFLLKFYPEYFKGEKKKFPIKIIDTIEFGSVNTKGKIYITKIDKIVIYNGESPHIFNDIEVGINLENFDNYAMLFSIDNLC